MEGVIPVSFRKKRRNIRVRESAAVGDFRMVSSGWVRRKKFGIFETLRMEKVPRRPAGFVPEIGGRNWIFPIFADAAISSRVIVPGGILFHETHRIPDRFGDIPGSWESSRRAGRADKKSDQHGTGGNPEARLRIVEFPKKHPGASAEFLPQVGREMQYFIPLAEKPLQSRKFHEVFPLRDKQRGGENEIDQREIPAVRIFMGDSEAM